MTWKDEIVEEVRAVRDEYAARFGYDLDAMYADLKAKELASGHVIANIQPVKPEKTDASTPHSELLPTG